MAEGGSLLIRAHSHIQDKEKIVTLRQKLEESNGISKAIVRYVFRTGEKVLLDNATQEGAFQDNPEVERMQLRSVLCLPII